MQCQCSVPDILYYLFDCDSEEEEIMANSKQTCSSMVHKSLTNFFKSNPITADYFASNLKCFTAMFNAMAVLWIKYNKAKSTFDTQGTSEEQILQATAIADCAVNI